MGGFRVADRSQVLGEGEVYEFTDGEVADSRGLAAALRERWLIETDAFGKPLAKAKPRKRADQAPRPPTEEADMYPNDPPVDEEAELRRVNAEEQSIRFEDERGPQDVANEMVATPAGPVGPRRPAADSKRRRAGRRKKKPAARAKRSGR